MNLRLPRIKLDLPPLGSRGGAAAPAVERVQNGGFASGANWATAGGWTIALGQATNDTPGLNLTNTLNSTITPGLSYQIFVQVIANPLGTSWGVVAFNSSTLATQNLMIIMDSATGIRSTSGTITGTFDQLYIQAADDAGLVIDNVSLLA